MRLVLAAVIAAVLTGCACSPRIEREIVIIDGEKFLCSKRVNAFGADSQPQCVRFEGPPTS